MVWINYGTYRGCTLKYSDTDPKLYWSPCVTYAVYSDSALRGYIDDTLGPPPEPPPEPPQDYIAETYRGVDIWWKYSINLYWAQVAVGYVAVWATLEEMRTSIDEILAFLEPPEDPDEGLFAQVVAAMQVWVNEIIGDRLQPVYTWIDNVLAGAQTAWEGLVAGAVTLITQVSGDLTNLATDMGDRWDTFTTLTLPDIWATINAQAAALMGTIDLKGSELEASMDAKLVDFAAWVRDLVKLSDPLNFLEDPHGFIGTAFNTLIAPWAQDIVTSFWEGFEEGLAE